VHDTERKLLLLIETLSLLAGLLLVALGLSVTATASEPSCRISIRSIDLIQVGPSALDPFRRPCGLVTDPQSGIIVVADSGRNRVVFIDRSGRSRGSLTWSADETGRAMGSPRAVALSPSGYVCVVGEEGAVEILTTTGSHLGFLEFAPIPGLAQQPRAVALSIGASGRFYVLRAGAASEIAIFEKNGQLLRSIDLDEETISTPLAVAVNDDETMLAVADPESIFQIKYISIDGEQILQFGPHGTGKGTFSLAIDVTWGPDHTLWVTDTMRHSVSVFDEQGNYLDRVGGFGHGPGQFNYPAACEFLEDNRIVVLERAGGHFQIVDLEMQLPGSDPFEELQPANAVGDQSEALVLRGKVKEQ